MRLILISFILLWAFVACDTTVPKQKKAQGLRFVKDEVGRTITIKGQLNRILPLCASSMEYALMLCDTSKIIASTTDFNEASWLEHKPRVSNYPLNMEAVIALQPDLVLVAEGMITSEQIQILEKYSIPIYVQKGNSLNAILASTHRLNQLFENRKAVKTWVEQQHQVLQKHKMNKHKASCLAIISTNPIYAYGHESFMTNLMETIGLENAIDSTITATYPMLSLEYVLRVNPTYIILPSNFETNQVLFVDYPLLKKTKAYQTKRVIYMNENLFSRPSPKAFELLPLLHQRVYGQE